MPNPEHFEKSSTVVLEFGATMAETDIFDRNVPQSSEAELRDLLRQRYKIDGEFQSIEAERDQLFVITPADGRKIALRVLQDRDAAEFQVRALQHLERHAPAIPVPRVILDRDGQSLNHHTSTGGGNYVVQVLSFLPGVTMSQVESRCDHRTRFKLGALVATVDTAWQGFFHPAAQQPHVWNLSECTRLTEHAQYIPDITHRKLAIDVFERMGAEVLPKVAALRHQVIHQDAHRNNVLVDPNDPQIITGLIDFGDMLFGSIAAEVAVACDGLSYGARDPLAAMCEVVAGFDSVLALTEQEIDIIFDLACARNAQVAVVVSARAALYAKERKYLDSAISHFERLGELNSLGRHAVTTALRRACRFPAWCPRSPAEALSIDEERELRDARRELLSPNTKFFYDQPQHFEASSGAFLFGTDGLRYLDCYNNVPQVGHSNPHVVKAISRQAAALNTNTRYLYSSVVEYAERLTDRLAPHLNACMFVNSGSEANDIAWQMARFATGRSGGLLMEDGYHGITEPILEFSPGHPDKILPPHLQGLLVPDPYRGPYRDGEPELAEKYAADADRAIADLNAAEHPLAAFFVDSAFCSSGVPEVPEGYLRGVEKRVKAAGGLMICDEVQSGFGRMGQWWGHEMHGVRADIVTMGKPAGNGHPLGVIVTSKELMNDFMGSVSLFSTFGGNTVACAAGNAVLDVIERESLIENGIEVGDYLRRRLRELAASQQLIGNVRGRGMLTGLEFVTDRELRTPATQETERLLEFMRRRQILVGKEGRDHNILKLRPPLVFDRTHVDLFINALDESLSELRSSL